MTISDDDLIGKIILDNYRIIEIIGGGYTSVVYLAEQISIKQDRAVKILRPEHIKKPRIVEQLNKEVNRQSALTHRNIVKIIDYGEYNGLPVVVQEFVDGGNLRSWLNKANDISLSTDLILQVIDDLLSAVNYMHSKNLMHMDIKPENILVSTDGSYRLADFGLVKQKGGSSETPIAGTLKYMHPDLHDVEILPRDKLEFKFDCYSIGRLIELDLLEPFKRVANNDDYVFLSSITKKAITTSGSDYYEDICTIQKDLDKLRNVYIPPTKVAEFSLRSSFMPTIRVPSEVSVGTTERVLKIIDTSCFQRLRNIKQLGPISFVYPGASHTRFEHSLGCYNNARRYLDALLRQPRFRFAIEGESDVLAVLAAALLHDIGHYPFSHPFEEAEKLAKSRRKNLPTLHHELLAKKIIFGTDLPDEVKKKLNFNNGTIAELLDKDWKIKEPDIVWRLISGRTKRGNKREALLSSIINGPIDLDKMDYLERDSIHTGVPYGTYIDKSRFFASLTINEKENGICLTDKGRIAAETFIFCRYAMTSEVYWHHAVRAVDVMVATAFDIIIQNVDKWIESDKLLEIMLLSNDQAFLEKLANVGENTEASELLRAVTTPNRNIYKRLATYSKVYEEDEKLDIYKKISDFRLEELVDFRDTINKHFLKLASMSESSNKYLVLVDVPPNDKDILDEHEILYPNVKKGEKQFYKLSRLSIIAEALGNDFQRSVKKIRIFCREDLKEKLKEKEIDIQEEIRAILFPEDDNKSLPGENDKSKSISD